MASTALVRQWWDFFRCTRGPKIDPALVGGRYPIYVQAEAQDAVAALFVAVQARGYVLDPRWPVAGYIGSHRYCPAGIGGKTCKPSGADCSLHNYSIALDFEYDHNPYLLREWRSYTGNPRATRPDPAWLFARIKLTPEQVYAVEAIRNVQGEQMFTWLGWSIADAMHFQMNVPPERCEVDWSTVAGAEEAIGMYAIGRGHNLGGEDVSYVQSQLIDLGFLAGPPDGVWDAGTEEAVEDFQRSIGAYVDGVIWGYIGAKLTQAHSKQGPKGAKGDRGVDGPRGLQGPRGPEGPPGAPSSVPDDVVRYGDLTELQRP